MKASSFAFSMLIIVAIALVADGREWVDNTGRFRIDGELLAVDKGYVTIQRADGKTVRVPLEKLSEKDRAYVTAQGRSAHDSPFEMVVTSPDRGADVSDRSVGDTADVRETVVTGTGVTEETRNATRFGMRSNSYRVM